MKKSGVILSVFLLIAIIYSTISLIFTAEKDNLFWTGFGEWSCLLFCLQES